MELKPSKVIKHVALVVAIWLFVRVVLVAIDSKAFTDNPLASLGIAAAMAALFLVLAYLGVDLIVKNFSYDGDEHKLSVNETDTTKTEGPKNDVKF